MPLKWRVHPSTRPSADDPEPQEGAGVLEGVVLGVRCRLELLELRHGDVVAVEDAHRALVAVPVAVVGRAEHRHHLKQECKKLEINMEEKL